MELLQSRESQLVLAIVIQIAIAVFGKLINVLSLFEAIAVWVALIVLTLSIYRYPLLIKRPIAAVNILLGKQPDPELAQLGVQKGVPSNPGSKFSPSSCMGRVERELDFMGMLGSKWVEKPNPYNRMERMVEEVDQRGGEIRFLLADWTSEKYEELLNRRNIRDMSLVRRADHYQDYFELAEEYECLEVRVYSNIPTFRMVFLDNQELGVSRYRYEPPDDEFDRGRKIPHLVIDKNAKFSLFQPYKESFEEIWEDSSELTEEHIPTPDSGEI